MMNLLTIPLAGGIHMGGWRHPDAWPNTVMNLDATIEITRIAERGKLDGVFLADGNAVRDVDRPALFEANTPSSRPSVFDPVTMFAAIARYTSHIGFVSTATTTYEQPYSVARRFASLDHISGGRAGWNVVTGSYAGDALNFSRAAHPPREERYERAAEFVEVVKGLWDSWSDDAFVQNKDTGQFLRPDRVHVLDHVGKHFQVKGPLNVARPPQGHPVIFMAGQSERGRELAAATADAMFASADRKEVCQSEYADIKGRMAKYGRDPRSLRFLPGMCAIVGESVAEAEDLFGMLQSLISPALGIEFLSKLLLMDLSGVAVDDRLPPLVGDPPGGTVSRIQVAAMAQREGLTVRQTYERALPALGNAVFKGTASHVADEMEDWYRSEACDGFIVNAPVMPQGLNAIVDRLVPELQHRGIFRREYAGRTLRENLGLAKPANRFFQ
jgi:alkanesulfonate monooxygenase